MQTFLPYPSFAKSAQALDNRRLGCQIKETRQIIDAIDDPGNGWNHHPVVNMWRGYRAALIEYGLACYDEWQRRLDAGERGGKRDHKSGEWLRTQAGGEVITPPWFGTWVVHSRYRSLLLAKGLERYGRFNWREVANSERYYPTDKDEWREWHRMILKGESHD